MFYKTKQPIRIAAFGEFEKVSILGRLHCMNLLNPQITFV